MLRRRGLAVAAFLVLSLLVQAQARLHWGAREDEPDSVASSLVEALPYDDPATDVDPRTDRSLGEAEEAEGDGEEAGDPSANEKHKETIAEILDEALKEEFKKEEEKKDDVGQHFNETAASDEGTKETVIIISSKKKGNATEEEHHDHDEHHATTATSAGVADTDARPEDARHIAGGSAALGEGAALVGADAADAAAAAEGERAATERGEEEKRKKELEEKLAGAAEADVDRIIDSKDNEYVLSKPNDDTMGMQLDPQFVKDLTILVAASAAAGLAMGALGQPAINGYFVAGSLVGPGGLKLIKEIVQVQSVAQLGVQLLLFTLGLEFSLTKLRAVRNVALLGGLLQTALSAVLAGVGAKLIGTSAAQGGFVGAIVAMSSTSIVVKVLSEARTTHTQQGQITVGTLILQDCLVGLLFAFMPVLAAAGGSSGFDVALLLSVMGHVVAKLAVLALGALAVSRTVLPPAMRALARRFGPDSFQLAAIAFCLLCALGTARQGISPELGAFVAGVMLSATEQQDAVLHHLEPLTQFFLTLFISSTGLVLSPVFLLDHLPVLAVGAAVVIASKTLLIALVVMGFGYPLGTALAVGLNLSQIGEFVFVLLSVANQQSLLPESVYMLLMGVTALTLLVTPFMLQISNRVIARSRAHPNGSSAADLEMAGLVNGQKRRLSVMAEQLLKSSPPLGDPAGRPPPPLQQPGQVLSGGEATQLQGGLAHSVQPGLTRLEHRGGALRTVHAQSSGGSSQADLLPGGSGGRGSPAMLASTPR